MQIPELILSIVAVADMVLLALVIGLLLSVLARLERLAPGNPGGAEGFPAHGACAAPDAAASGQAGGAVPRRQPSGPPEPFLDRLNSLVADNVHNPDYSVNDLARGLYVSRSALFSKVKELTGETPNNLLNNARLDLASRLLRQEGRPVSEICFMVGFSSPSYFTKCFEKRFGVTPYVWMRKKQE